MLDEICEMTGQGFTPFMSFMALSDRVATQVTFNQRDGGASPRLLQSPEPSSRARSKFRCDVDALSMKSPVVYYVDVDGQGPTGHQRDDDPALETG